MSYFAPIIECMRFAGRKGGIGIGCCAIDVLQGFNTDPDAPASVALKNGDSGTVCMKNNKAAYLGRTNREIFLGYLRIGTFDIREMPNRVFLAALTQNQCVSVNGKKWLALLKENGFEFVRATDNSVYSGPTVSEKQLGEGAPIYIFALFRNIGATRLKNPFAVPPGWDALPNAKSPFELWNEGKTNILTKEEAEIKPSIPATPTAV